MNWITFGIGVFALLYGFCTLYFRFKAPEKFGRLEAMQKFYGARTGNVIHICRYTVMPFFFGIVMIFAGLKGISFLGM